MFKNYRILKTVHFYVTFFKLCVLFSEKYLLNLHATIQIMSFFRMRFVSRIECRDVYIDHLEIYMLRELYRFPGDLCTLCVKRNAFLII